MPNSDSDRRQLILHAQCLRVPEVVVVRMHIRRDTVVALKLCMDRHCFELSTNNRCTVFDRMLRWQQAPDRSWQRRTVARDVFPTSTSLSTSRAWTIHILVSLWRLCSVQTSIFIFWHLKGSQKTTRFKSPGRGNPWIYHIICACIRALE